MSRQSPVVLIADDNADIRAVLGVLLRGSGYGTVIADNGEQAVSLAAETLPDLVLIDMAMPKMDGLAAARSIRRIGGLEKVPIVGCSAYEPEAEDLLLGPGAPLDAFLRKPTDFGELLSVIASLTGTPTGR
jgi:CheY-like chemotaxis protein